MTLADRTDELIERNNRLLSREPVTPRTVSNLQNWISGNGCMAREETAYLARPDELVSVAPTDDTVMTWLDTLVEDGWARLRPYLPHVRHLHGDRQTMLRQSSGVIKISHGIPMSTSRRSWPRHGWLEF
jgi:hypothetical protein